VLVDREAGRIEIIGVGFGRRGQRNRGRTRACPRAVVGRVGSGSTARDL
jgi:hypothetical protein